MREYIASSIVSKKYTLLYCFLENIYPVPSLLKRYTLLYYFLESIYPVPSLLKR